MYVESCGNVDGLRKALDDYEAAVEIVLFVDGKFKPIECVTLKKEITTGKSTLVLSDDSFHNYGVPQFKLVPYYGEDEKEA